MFVPHPSSSCCLLQAAVCAVLREQPLHPTTSSRASAGSLRCCGYQPRLPPTHSQEGQVWCLPHGTNGAYRVSCDGIGSGRITDMLGLTPAHRPALSASCILSASAGHARLPRCLSFGWVTFSPQPHACSNDDCSSCTSPCGAVEDAQQVQQLQRELHSTAGFICIVHASARCNIHPAFEQLIRQVQQVTGNEHLVWVPQSELGKNACSNIVNNDDTQDGIHSVGLEGAGHLQDPGLSRAGENTGICTHA